MDPCRKALNERIAACANDEMSKPGRNSSDFSFWQTCRARYQPDYDRCVDQMAGNDDAHCAEARENIDWVLERDAGAQGTYRLHRAGGKRPFEAVLAAQAHNPEAQRAIRACTAWAERYIAGKLSGGQAAGPLVRSYEDLCARMAGNPQVQAVLGCAAAREDPKGTRDEIEMVSREACGRLAQACERETGAGSRDELMNATQTLSCRTRYGSGCGGRNPYPEVVLNAGVQPAHGSSQGSAESSPGTVGTAGIGVGPTAASAACIRRLRRQRLVMMQNAEQCRVNAAVMGDMRNEKEVAVDCRTSIPGYVDQRVSQLTCGRVYVCATNALTVAMKEAANGVDCATAQNIGLARYPIPSSGPAVAVQRPAAPPPTSTPPYVPPDRGTISGNLD